MILTSPTGLGFSPTSLIVPVATIAPVNESPEANVPVCETPAFANQVPS